MSSKAVTIEAGTGLLTELLERVERGEEFSITRDKQPVAKLALFSSAQQPRTFGY